MLLQAAYLYWEKLHENLLWIGERWNSGACKYRFQYLILVYQLLVYPTIGQLTNNNNIFISYIKYTNITPPANSKANRGRWCVDGLRFITNSWSEIKVPYL